MRMSSVRVGIAIAALVAAASFSLLLNGCGEKGTAGPGGPVAVPVRVYQLRPGQASYFDRYPASVVALKQVDLRPEVSGYITRINSDEGKHVRKGTTLYEIEQRPYRASYDQAVANLNVAKANLQRAQQDAARYDSLAKYDAVAVQTLQHAQADLQTARMQMAAAEANVKNVGTNLEHSIIRAPFDCTVGISQVEIGSEVSAGQTLLNTISSDNPMGVDCAIDQKQIARFAGMVGATGQESDSIFTLILPDGSIYPYPGTLSLLDRAVDPATGTIRARFVFSNPQNALKPGLSCDLRVKSFSRPNSILIPSRALTEQMGEYFVFVVNGNRAIERKVIPGPVISDKTVITSGLASGELLVTDGLQSLRDSSLIAILSPKEQPAGPSPARR